MVHHPPPLTMDPRLSAAILAWTSFPPAMIELEAGIACIEVIHAARIQVRSGGAVGASPLFGHDEDGLARLAALLLGLERGATLAERPSGTDHGAQFARRDLPSHLH